MTGACHAIGSSGAVRGNEASSSSRSSRPVLDQSNRNTQLFNKSTQLIVDLANHHDRWPGFVELSAVEPRYGAAHVRQTEAGRSQTGQA